MLERKTKIIATLGPASFSPASIKQLINTGVNIFRLNFSHTDHVMGAKAIENIRSLSEKTKKKLLFQPALYPRIFFLPDCPEANDNSFWAFY